MNGKIAAIIGVALLGGIVLTTRKTPASAESTISPAETPAISSGETSAAGGSSGSPGYDLPAVLISQRIAYYRAAYGVGYSDALKLAKADKADPGSTRAIQTAIAILAGAVGTGPGSLIYQDKSGGSSSGEAWKLLSELNQYDTAIRLTGGVEGAAQGAAVITIIPVTNAGSAGLWA